jgi:hypothetical protein
MNNFKLTIFLTIIIAFPAAKNTNEEIYMCKILVVRFKTSIGVVIIGAWVPGHPHFLSVMVQGTASKHGHPGCRAHGTPTFEILSTPLKTSRNFQNVDLLNLRSFCWPTGSKFTYGMKEVEIFSAPSVLPLQVIHVDY